MSQENMYQESTVGEDHGLSEDELVSLSLQPSLLKRALFQFAAVATVLAGVALTVVQIALIGWGVLLAPLWVVPMLLAVVLSFSLYTLARRVIHGFVQEKMGGYKTAISAALLAVLALLLLIAAPLLLVSMPAWIMPVLLVVALVFPVYTFTKGIAAYFSSKQKDSLQLASLAISSIAFLAVVSVALMPFFSTGLPVSLLLLACVALSFSVVCIYHIQLRKISRGLSYKPPIEQSEQESESEKSTISHSSEASQSFTLGQSQSQSQSQSPLPQLKVRSQSWFSSQQRGIKNSSTASASAQRSRHSAPNLPCTSPLPQSSQSSRSYSSAIDSEAQLRGKHSTEISHLLQVKDWRLVVKAILPLGKSQDPQKDAQNAGNSTPNNEINRAKKEKGVFPHSNLRFPASRYPTPSPSEKIDKEGWEDWEDWEDLEVVYGSDTENEELGNDEESRPSSTKRILVAAN